MSEPGATEIVSTPAPPTPQQPELTPQQLETFTQAKATETKLNRIAAALKKAKTPEGIGMLASGAIGLLGIINNDPALGQLAMMAGGGAVGLGRAEGIGGRLTGAVVGMGFGAAASEGIHHLPIDYNFGATVGSVGDDLLPLLAVGAIKTAKAIRGK